jgi:TRAP-type C4-dicarboxylate transport system permease small subunit
VKPNPCAITTPTGEKYGLQLFDKLGDRLATLSAWLFFAVGGMITWEVLARYLFNAPTIWAEEMSRFFQIWATYLAMAALLRQRRFIRITLLTDHLGPRARWASELFGLLVIAGFSATATWYGFAIVEESVRVGRATSTMMQVPRWATESAIPLGFGLLTLQSVIEIARLRRAAR